MLVRLIEGGLIDQMDDHGNFILCYLSSIPKILTQSSNSVTKLTNRMEIGHTWIAKSLRSTAVNTEMEAKSIANKIIRPVYVFLLVSMGPRILIRAF
jgi:hypothetical protein